MKETPMPNSVTVLSLSLSIVALILAVYAASVTWNISQNPAPADTAANVEMDELADMMDDKINRAMAAQGNDQQEPSAPTAPTAPVEVSQDDDPVKGDPDAPITIIEFSDYQCPYCQRFFLNTLPQLTEEYIDTGKVKLVYRDFPLDSIHPQARPAAIAAECVQELEGDEVYFQYHDQLFENIGSLGEDLYLQLAQNLGINQSDFEACLTDPEMNDEVNQDLAEGQAAGVRGTPAFFVNGRMLSGAQPFAAFQAIIEQELSDE